MLPRTAGEERAGDLGAATTLPLRDPAEQAEIALVHAIAGGERAAFDALYRAYRPRLARFVSRLTRRPALLEELIDDTLLVVWRSAARFNGSSRVSTWIFAIAYRKSLKALERLDEPVDDEGLPEAVDPAPGPEQRLDARQRRERLEAGLAALSAPQRAVVELTYFHGMGYREIAAIVECPLDTVKTRMFHARRRLKALLAGSAEDWL